jgi:hypothetical protein
MPLTVSYLGLTFFVLLTKSQPTEHKGIGTDGAADAHQELDFDEVDLRDRRQIDRTDALLGGFNVIDAAELPLHEATGEKTRKTYDFTRKH